MRRETTAAGRARPCAATASYTVQFQKRPRRRAQCQQETTAGRIPKVTRLLALAHKIDGPIRAGEIKDWAEAARLVGITRARMTQIGNLLLLTPTVQEAVIELPPILRGGDQLTERHLRRMAGFVDWRRQEADWAALPRQARPLG